MDRISDLPDELLHGILLHLRSTLAAARTSVLSRRWRRVWASLPDLVLIPDDLIHPRASFLDTIDGALAAYTADQAIRLRRLKILVLSGGHYNVSASRVAAWLLIASRRLAGELDLHVSDCTHNQPPAEIELPPFERATSIALVLRVLLRTPRPSVFAALVDLSIGLATIDARALEVLVSSQCPRLQKLTLQFVRLVNYSDVSISSASLQRLKYHVRMTRRLDVVAPNLQELDASHVVDAHIAAPNLAVFISDYMRQFVFADSVRHLRLLEVTYWSPTAPLMRQLDTVDELRLHAPYRKDNFQIFMDNTKNLPKCETMSVSLTGDPHGAVASVLHLLRRGRGIRKLVLLLAQWTAVDCYWICPCRSSQSAVEQDIRLDSLEEIEFRLLQRGDEYMEVLKRLLSIRSLTKLKNVEIDVSYSHHGHAAPLCDEVYQKIRHICPTNIRVNVLHKGRCQNQN